MLYGGANLLIWPEFTTTAKLGEAGVLHDLEKLGEVRRRGGAALQTEKIGR